MGEKLAPMLLLLVFGTCHASQRIARGAAWRRIEFHRQPWRQQKCRTRQREALATPSPDTCAHYIHTDPPAGNGALAWLSTEAVRQMAQAVPGNRARLRAALGRFLESENLTVAFIGGSITAGQGAVDGMAFPFWAEAAMHAAMGNKFNVKNSAMPGTLSSYMSVCHNVFVAQEADIYFVDYTLNDPHDAHPIMENPIRRAFERLLRKLIITPSEVVYVWVMLHARLPGLRCIDLHDGRSAML